MITKQTLRVNTFYVISLSLGSSDERMVWYAAKVLLPAFMYKIIYVTRHSTLENKSPR